MGKIYNCVRMKCKTLYQQIHALFSMGSELEDAVTSDINNFEQRLDNYADVNMQNSQDIQDLYESDSKIRITANKNKEDIDILKPKVAKNTEDIASIEGEIGSIDLPGTIYNKINQNKLAIDEINSSDVMQSGISKAKVDQIDTNTADIVLNTADIVLNKQEIAKINNSDVMKSGINATKVTQIETNKNNIDTINTNIQANKESIDTINASEVMNSGINTTKVNQIETNKNAIATANDNIENNTTAITTINNSDVMKSGINTTKVTQIETNKNKITELDTTLKTAINSVNITGNAESITHIATKIDGTTEEDALPIASEVKAGILSATSYKSFSDGIAGLRQDVNALQDGSKIYELTGLTINATSSEITTKFVATYGQDKLKAGITAVQYDIGAQWKYTGTSWIIVGNTVPVATNDSFGVVQGSTVDGQIFVETNGQMSLNGYDTIKTDINNKQSQLTTTQLEAVNSGINSVKVGQIETNKNAIATANENITQNTNDIADIQTSDIMTSGINSAKVKQIGDNATAIGTINASDVMKSGINAVKVKQIGDNKTAIDTINASDVMKSGINATKVGQIETNRLAIVTANGEIEKNTTAINTINNSDVMKSGINSTIVQQVGTNKTGITTVNGRVDTLEESVNGVQTNVTNLSSSVSTLEGKVNNNTTNVNNISADVNAMKTGKQDKLVAGNGITIASDGKTISTNEVEPQKIPINDVLDLIDAITNMKVGDRLVGESLYRKDNAEGINQFDLEKLNFTPILGSYKAGIIARKHCCSKLRAGSSTQYYVDDKGLSDIFSIRVSTSNNVEFFSGSILLKSQDYELNYDISSSSLPTKIALIPQPNSQTKYIFKNIYWLKY